MRFWIILFFSFLIVSCNQEPDTIQYKSHNVGDVIDQLNKINVYYNGDTVLKSYGNNNVNGYYCGKKWQCVEFIKRYYFLHLKHEMPDGWTCIFIF